MDLVAELERLDQLHSCGRLSDSEYASAKAAVLRAASSPQGGASGPGRDEHAAHEAPSAPGSPPPAGAAPVAARSTSWASWLHLSLLSGLLIPYAGFIVPIVIWNVKRDELPELGPHASVVFNWIASLILYSLVFFLLAFVLIGLPLLWLLGLLSLIFPIVGAIKAGNGEVWSYPGSIRFWT